MFVRRCNKTTTHERICENYYERNDDDDAPTLESSLSTSDLVVGVTNAKRKERRGKSILRPFFSSASLFLPIASSLRDTLSLSLSRCASARARAIPLLLRGRSRAASPPVSRGARDTFTVKVYTEKGNRRKRTVVSSGGTRRERKIAREIHP